MSRQWVAGCNWPGQCHLPYNCTVHSCQLPYIIHRAFTTTSPISRLDVHGVIKSFHYSKLAVGKYISLTRLRNFNWRCIFSLQERWQDKENLSPVMKRGLTSSLSEGGYRQYGDTLQLPARSNKRTQRFTILEAITYFCQMRGPYRGNYDAHCLSGYDAVSFGRNVQNFAFVFK